MEKQTKKSAPALVRKPWEKGNPYSAYACRQGLRLLTYWALFALAHLLLGGALQSDARWIRWALCLGLTAGEILLLYRDGARLGEKETARGESMYLRRQAGKDVSASDLDRCFHPGKGWLMALTAAVPLALLCVPYAILAQKQVYTLQALPAWVAAYEGHEEIAQALQYYRQTSPLTALDVLRLAVRALTLPFVGVAEGADALLLADRLSPLLACLPLLGFPLGYGTGPRARAAVHGSIQENARKRQRREQKARQARKRPPAGKNEIV